MIYWQLFLSFLRVGLFSIGGGYAAMPIIQGQVVDRYAWITLREFTDLVAIAEMTPGPIAINSATFVGIRMAGIPGAIVATLGCILPSFVTVSILSLLYIRYRTSGSMQTVLSFLRPVVVALIAAAAVVMLRAVTFSGAAQSLKNVDWAGVCLALLAFLCLRKRKLQPIVTMFLCGICYLGLRLLSGQWTL